MQTRSIRPISLDFSTYTLECALKSRQGPHLKCTDKWVASRTITKMDDLKEGSYLRVYYQPIFTIPLSVSVTKVFGKPFKRASSIGRDWRMPLVKSTKLVDKTDPLWWLDSEHFVSSLGVDRLPLRDSVPRMHQMSVRLFRFSNRLQNFLKDLQDGDPFLSYCWFYSASPTPGVFELYEEYLCRTAQEEELSEHLSEQSYREERNRMHDEI